MAQPPVHIRPATRDDALDLAQLIDIAGEGIPSYLWQQSCAPEQTALERGCQRAARDEGAFSYRNARVAIVDEQMVGMVLDYPILEPTEQELEQVPTLPEVVRPFVELEYRAIGSWYINALAVYAPYRNLGIGKCLLKDAQQRAMEKGCDLLSIQVFSQNLAAVALYHKMGFRLARSRPVLLHPCPPFYDEDVWLMIKPCFNPAG
ncbi:GNAT family N-acetyltransferase [Bowmanella dokdonensis]|uniref:GNAT family N-acetyltransferase n=1 Tax=Bowmanella dokdonensis TaxID=751969 RepID=A0A939DP87_9ALTE|nr:GNAT family N-acetyltransferase [Bowmanella dokdonensis]MBN7825416.1 GNAT family N-acetyltransferase [Bowmanella dokdonensis]